MVGFEEMKRNSDLGGRDIGGTVLLADLSHMAKRRRFLFVLSSKPSVHYLATCHAGVASLQKILAEKTCRGTGSYLNPKKIAHLWCRLETLEILNFNL